MEKLTPKQQIVVDGCVDFLKSGDRGYKVIAGYAGTGKTTVIQSIVDSVYGGSISALCGKAVDRLKKKGVSSATTIHKAIYDFDGNRKRFYLKPSLPCKYRIIDEGSMVGSKLWKDERSFNPPTLIFGDPFQLPPVADADIGLMEEPDYFLDEIIRQELDNPIVALATEIRQRRWDPTPFVDNNCDIMWPDVIVTGYKRTKDAVNNNVRKAKGFKGDVSVGDKLRCLTNKPEQGTFNGSVFTVLSKTPSGYCECVDDEGLTVVLAPVVTKDRPSYKDIRGKYANFDPVDYAFAITAHSAQGSEYEKVLYIDEPCDKWDRWRHRYTGVTRAISELKLMGSF